MNEQKASSQICTILQRKFTYWLHSSQKKSLNIPIERNTLLVQKIQGSKVVVLWTPDADHMLEVDFYASLDVAMEVKLWV